MKDFVANLFKGRLNRANLVVGMFSSIVLPRILFFFINHEIVVQSRNLYGILHFFWWIIFVLVFIFNFSLYARRYHDIGKSGYNVFFLLIPLVNFILLFFLIFKKGDSVKNVYGKVPSSKISFPADILGIDK